MTTIYVQLDCRIYFLGSSFLGSGFGVGNLNVSGFLSTPGPTCYTELVSLNIYFLWTRYIPPTLQCHPRSFERPALILTVLPQCASSPRHIEFPCNLSMGNPFGVDGHQSRSRSWYVVNQDARWRRHRKDHTPLVHTSLLHRTGSWCLELVTLRLHTSWLEFLSCVGHSISCRRPQIAGLEWGNRQQ